MSIRRLTAMAAGGLLMTLATGRLSPLQAQESASVEADADIVREVTTRNLLELRLADMAKKKSTNASVKSFAERMQTDHLNMHKQLEALVGQNGQPFRTGLGKMEPQLAEVRQLEKLSGNQFDQQYMASMIRHHQDNVSYFQSTANSARSSQVRALLANNLPVLQQHLSLAIQVGSQVGATPAVATGTPNLPSNVPAANPTLPGGQNAPVVNPNLPGGQNAPVASEQERKDAKKDRKFLVEAVQSNALEIRLAQFAQKNATYGGLRRLAARIASENTAMQNRWLALAARHGVKLTPGIGPWHLKKAQRVEATPRADFDRAYTAMLINNHQDYVKSFQKEGPDAHSASVRNQAANDLTTVRQLLASAQQVGTQLGVDSTARNLSSYKN
ncbi:MAG: putative rane protein [Gemmatimonadales bacterium]|nr:putative rane protein [Gemmatimonadales bacterium]